MASIRVISSDQLVGAWNLYCDCYSDESSKVNTETELISKIAYNSENSVLSFRPFSNGGRTSAVHTEIVLNNGMIDTSSLRRGDIVTALNESFIFNGRRLECLNLTNSKPLIPKHFRGLSEFPLNYWSEVSDKVYVDLSGLINTLTNIHYSVDERVVSGNFDFDGRNYNINVKVNGSTDAVQQLAIDFGLMNSILISVMAIPQWFGILPADNPLSLITVNSVFSGFL